MNKIVQLLIKKSALCVLCLVLVSSQLFGSVFASSLMWSKTYGGDGRDLCSSMVQTADGGFVLFGPTGLLVKTDADGNMQWNQTIDGSVSFIQTSDGGFAFVGTKSASLGVYVYVGSLPEGFWSHVWLAKTDAYGNMEWNQTFDEEVGYYNGASLVQTDDGGYALLGNSFSSIGDYDDALLIKTDSYGNKEWSKLYDYPEQTLGYSLIQALDEGFVFTRETVSSVGGFAVIKTDAAGNVIWNQTYPDLNLYDVHSFDQLSDGSFVLSGITYYSSSTDGQSEFYLTKLDKNGAVAWCQTYRTYDGERSVHSSVVQTSDDGFALGCYSVNATDDLYTDFVVIKTDNQGNLQWNQTCAKGILLGFPSIIQTSDNSFVLSCAVGSWETGDFDFWLMKTEPCDIPEFPSWIILPLFLGSAFVIVFVKKKNRFGAIK